MERPRSHEQIPPREPHAVHGRVFGFKISELLELARVVARLWICGKGKQSTAQVEKKTWVESQNCCCCCCCCCEMVVGFAYVHTYVPSFCPYFSDSLAPVALFAKHPRSSLYSLIRPRREFARLHSMPENAQGQSVHSGSISSVQTRDPTSKCCPLPLGARQENHVMCKTESDSIRWVDSHALAR